jgi:flavin reductase (DIM6/NTAB) family NADH-FMN oxidoreductase RutF
MPKYESKDPGFFTQQVMLIGTYDEDGKERFCPISWVSYTWGPPSCLVVSIWGVKKTKDNIARSGLFSATVLTPDLLPLAEQFNRGTYKKDLFENIKYNTQRGATLDVPLLLGAKYSFECKVLTTTEVGETITYFGEIANVNMSDDIRNMDIFDLRKINPVVYSPNNYFTIGEHLGEIGDFSKN